MAGKKGQKKRFWSDKEKVSICAQAWAPGAAVAQVPRGYAMNTNLIHKWLRDPKFAPAPVVHTPARVVQEASDHTVAIASVLIGHLPAVCYERLRFHGRDIVRRRIALEELKETVTERRPREDHPMKGRPKPTQTALIPGQPHAAGICNEIETRNQGGMRPKSTDGFPAKLEESRGAGHPVCVTRPQSLIFRSQITFQGYLGGEDPAQRNPVKCCPIVDTIVWFSIGSRFQKRQPARSPIE